MNDNGDAPFVVVIGGTNIDIHGKPANALRRHDSNPGVVNMSPGGVARNVADNLARLGADCRLVSAVGSDDHGRLLLRRCREAGIDTQHVQEIDSLQTSIYLSVLDKRGEMDVAINDMTIIEELGPERLRAQEAMLKNASLIVIDTNLRVETIAWIASTCSEQALFVDTVSTAKAGKIKQYLDAVHTLKTSRAEAEALTGMKCATQADRRKLAAWVHGQGVRRLFITLGSRGVFYSTDDVAGVETPGIEKSTIRNTGGAGDAFLAGIAFAWLKGWPLMKSVHFAMAAATVTMSDKATSSTAMSLAAVNRICRSQRARKA